MFSLHGAWVSENYCFSCCTAVCLVSPDFLVWLVWVGQRCWYQAGRETNSWHTEVRFLPLEHVWKSVWISEQDAGEHPHLSVGSSSMNPFSYSCLVESHPALGDKNIEWCCLWCAVMKPGKTGKSLALDRQVRSDFWILGIVVSFPDLSPGNL